MTSRSISASPLEARSAALSESNSPGAKRALRMSAVSDCGGP